MQNVEITIHRQYIYEYVTTLTGTLGRQKENYDKYVCLPENYPVLDRFMDTAIAVLEAALWRRMANTRLTTLQYDNTNVTVTINNSHFPDRLQGNLATCIRLALAYLLAGMWLQGIEDNLYAHYAEIADKYISNAVAIASQQEIANINYQSGNPDNVSLAKVSHMQPAGDKDTINIDTLHKTETGEPKMEDTHIAQHSNFDNAIFYPDGSEAFL